MRRLDGKVVVSAQEVGDFCGGVGVSGGGSGGFGYQELGGE
jgi:hypothetical protein